MSIIVTLWIHELTIIIYFIIIQEFKHISITDITIEEVEDLPHAKNCKRVTIRFVLELPKDWKEKFTTTKYDFIVEIIEQKARSLSTSV